MHELHEKPRGVRVENEYLVIVASGVFIAEEEGRRGIPVCERQGILRLVHTPESISGVGACFAREFLRRGVSGMFT